MEVTAGRIESNRKVEKTGESSRVENIPSEKELFRKLRDDEKNDEFIAVESRTFLQSAIKRFTKNKRAVIGLIILAIVVLFAIFGPMFCKYSYSEQNTVLANAGPSMDHFFGTDKFGRDIYSRILSGARISLLVGLVAALGNLIIGTIYGGIAGYFGGKVDTILMRIVDIIYSIPAMLYIVLIMLIFGASVVSIIIGISITSWIDMARIVRSEIKSLKKQEFTMAAFVLGASDKRILFKHLLINAVGSIVVTVTLMVPQAIFTEAWLSFLGVGISAPQASWGTLAQDARALLQVYPMQTVYPLVAICVTIFAFTFVGEGLGAALDPKTKK
ncbi:oligopeptide transport system permease protein OppC [Lachnospiraceae bacterium KM106-2]|nr:oligopeptide transport system permease protein OppC [Lachnospiraceae bacterium KM106-2]